MASVWHLTRMPDMSSVAWLISRTMAPCHFTVRSPLNKQGQTLFSLSMSHTKYSDSNAGTQWHRKSESHKSVHLLMLLETVMPAVIHHTGLQWLSSCLRSNFSSHLSKFSICVHSPTQNPKNWYVKSLMCLLTTSCRFAFYMLPHLYIAQCIIPTLVTLRST